MCVSGSGFLQLFRLHNWSLDLYAACVCRTFESSWLEKKNTQMLHSNGWNSDFCIYHVDFLTRNSADMHDAWQSLAVFDQWIWYVFLSLVQRLSPHTYCLIKIIKAMYGLFLYTHPYLHMYINLHALF